MALEDKSPAEQKVTVYRHQGAKRKNNPPAGLAAQGRIAEKPVLRYAYNPHLPPALRFDPTGRADALADLLQAARQRPLTAEEVALLAGAAQNHEPWLEWAGKQERRGFQVDPVALHIHERVSTQAILKVAARQDVQRDLFADPELEYRDAVRFYQHDVAWSNRLILGDSLTVMASLAHREDLAGKVQMIYVDPPYGIRFASNFQPQVGRRDVKDRQEDLTREPEMVKAYRDTWTLGLHSYLAYLRDRLCLAKALLADSGSIFVQIGDENLHRVRAVMDEVFGSANSVCTITYRTSVGLGGKFLDGVCNHLLWFVRDREAAEKKYRQLYQSLTLGDEGATRYRWAESSQGVPDRLLTDDELERLIPGKSEWRPYTDQGLTSRSGGESSQFRVEFEGQQYRPTVGGWRTGPEGMGRVLGANRIMKAGQTIRFKKFFDDFGAIALTNFWDDVGGGIQSRSDPKVFVVQTATRIVERCLLMTTEPGDLVLDPTCGSGTTAYVAEQWGRRWITIDTSRVALAIARQRLLTARYDYYRLRDEPSGLAGGFRYRTVPHITLKSIAQNASLDPIFAKHAPLLAERLGALNAALAAVDGATRTKLAAKLLEKERRQGRSAVTDADRRRWLLPKGRWEEWEVPFDTDPDWPEPLAEALLAYRAAWRAKMDEVNACIATGAEREDLVDQPEVEKRVVRVSGPFTVEAVQPPEERLELDPSPVDEPDGELDGFDADGHPQGEPANAEAYLDRMLRLLRSDGVRFPDNRQVAFTRLEPLPGQLLHAEGDWAANGGQSHRVAATFGPQYGPVTAQQVEQCLWAASRGGYDDLVFAGFTFDAAAQAAIQDDPNPRVRCHLAHIRPDVNLGGLLKDTPNSQLFTVFGLPRTKVERTPEGQWVATMEGVDVYNPVDNSLVSTGADKVAAWFLDGDYDGRTFCITQAFFPDRSAWEKLARALKGIVDQEAFAAFAGTVSLPFPAGQHRRAAVKVIDPRGNEVMRVHRLEEEATYGR